MDGNYPGSKTVHPNFNNDRFFNYFFSFSSSDTNLKSKTTQTKTTKDISYII